MDDSTGRCQHGKVTPRQRIAGASAETGAISFGFTFLGFLASRLPCRSPLAMVSSPMDWLQQIRRR
jgi:hypothetical protein